MGKKSRKVKKRRPFLAQARHLESEEAFGLKREILCVQCKRPGVWVHKEEFTGRKLMRTSPFLVVDTPHGSRSIHDWCLFQIQMGKESPAPAYVPKPEKPVHESEEFPVPAPQKAGFFKQIFSRGKVA